MTLQHALAELAARIPLDGDSLSLLWGAFTGDEPLARALAGEAIGPPAEEQGSVAPPVWLSSIGVEGFRGIGSRTELLLEPQPGLTLVVGRNGSGKSSFAEALEAIELADLGWHEALTSYKPFLSCNELGSMLEERPSAIHDSMAAVLGLDRLADTRDRLRQVRLEAAKPAKGVAKTKAALADDLAGSDDPRAAEAHRLLTARSPDLALLDDLALGHGASSAPALVALAQLADVDRQRSVEAHRALTEAVAQRRGVADADAARSTRLVGLLRQAHDDSTDPLDRAHDDSTGPGGPDGLAVQQRKLDQRWTGWSSPPVGGWTDEALADRLSEVDELNAAIGRLRAAAGAALAAHDADWRRLAHRLTGWVDSAREAAAATATAERLKAVEDLATGAEATIRADRFRPIAHASARLWTQLRQQSNVNLERVALEGRNTNRRVDLDVTVDGAATSALGVMSQGELRALALALFLPRVTAAESPFRFVVIDDPVQAMDPARVDGLADVLALAAAERQVVVFTHDDLLPASCRRLAIDADVIEITRQTGSRVTATPSTSPAAKAIDDAYALARTRPLPDPLKRQVVPIRCRWALEAEVCDLAWPRLLAAGHTHQQIDRFFERADTTNQVLALLLFGERRSTTTNRSSTGDGRAPSATPSSAWPPSTPTPTSPGGSTTPGPGSVRPVTPPATTTPRRWRNWSGGWQWLTASPGGPD